jgi:hypothetical protein
MTWREASARRLARHHLTEGDRAGEPAVAAAGALGIHAQVRSAAEVSIGIRTGGVTRAGVRDALWVDRSLIKSRGPRGTVHLLPAADLPMWTGALRAVPTGPSPFAPDVRMTAAQTDLVVAAIADAVLTAETPLTVDELTAAIVERVGPWAGERVMPAFQDLWPRWRQAEAAAMQRGAARFGPDRARRATYTRPVSRPAPAEEALPALVTRYLPLLVDGVVAGVWHQRRSGRRIAVTVEPFAPPGPRLRRLLDAEAQRIGEILEGRAELTIGTVTVGPHA